MKFVISLFFLANAASTTATAVKNVTLKLIHTHTQTYIYKFI